MVTEQDFERRIDFLVQSGASRTLHSGRSLLEHLIGVREILRRWECPPPVCDAGLFHTAYGTETFQHAGLAESERDRLRALIGVEAEELAYLFGVKRSAAFLGDCLDAVKAGYRWTNGVTEPLPRQKLSIEHRVTGERIPISGNHFLHLVQLTIANALEQAPRMPEHFAEPTRLLYHSLTPLLPPRSGLDLGALLPVRGDVPRPPHPASCASDDDGR